MRAAGPALAYVILALAACAATPDGSPAATTSATPSDSAAASPSLSPDPAPSATGDAIAGLAEAELEIDPATNEISMTISGPGNAGDVTVAFGSLWATAVESNVVYRLAP